MSVNFKDNSGAIKRQMAGNVARALTAMGHVGVEATIKTMESGYGDPVHETGDLMRSITFEAEPAEEKVTWGTNIEYGPFVHEGTQHMKDRPFLRDGILKNQGMLTDMAKHELKKGF